VAQGVGPEFKKKKKKQPQGKPEKPSDNNRPRPKISPHFLQALNPVQ
jgi:hypothetical protein